MIKNRKKILLATTFLVCLFGTSLMPSFGFSTNPQYTDPAGDQDGDPAFTDMRYIWIDDNVTHLMFKIEFGAVWNQSGYGVYIYISTGENTSQHPSVYVGAVNITENYGLYFYADEQNFDFYDANPSNGLDDVVTLGMGYYIFSNNNQTLEIGYKIRAYSGGKGYLDLSPGQTIQIRIMTGGDTDLAPDFEQNLISYTLSGGTNPILIILIILFPVIGLALGLFIYYRRKDIL